MPIDITPELIASYRESSQGRGFSDVNAWPDDVVADALCEADVETGGAVWGTYQDLCSNFKRRGMFLYASHWLAITYRTGSAMQPNMIDSQARFNVASKSVGDESTSFQTRETQTIGNDWLALTNYGVQYMRLRNRAVPIAKAV